MYAILKGHAYSNEVQTITQLFFPNESFHIADMPREEGLTVATVLDAYASLAVVYENGEKVLEQKLPLNEAEDQKNLIKLTMFKALSRFTGISPPWGILTGIRPTKIIHELWRQGYNDRDVLRHMEKMLVTPDKAALCLDVAQAEKSIIRHNDGKQISLYIGIPFCPTRCLYCSFTSYPLAQYAGFIDAYLAALIRELTFLSPFTAAYELETIYIGGGTPTSLSAQQLSCLLDTICSLFSFKNIREFTVEAGRPDTITREKLKVMKAAGVSRLSVNTQTLRDNTLAAIGRKHTSREFLQAFELAREEGFNNINVDIILGLSGEELSDVQYTLEGLIPLSPEGITAHTLSVKRASRLKEELCEGITRLPQAEVIEQMLTLTKTSLENSGLYPYYLYRQKNMPGNFENVGYCRKGCEGIYNIQIMEERQTILAAGAGATTKTVDPVTNRIDRIFNVKNVEEYINRIDEMIQRKERLYDCPNPKGN